MILAFAIAMNERHNASSDLEVARNDEERKEALTVMEHARSYSQRLRTEVFDHCQQHGC